MGSFSCLLITGQGIGPRPRSYQGWRDGLPRYALAPPHPPFFVRLRASASDRRTSSCNGNRSHRWPAGGVRARDRPPVVQPGYRPVHIIFLPTGRANDVTRHHSKQPLHIGQPDGGAGDAGDLEPGSDRPRSSPSAVCLANSLIFWISPDCCRDSRGWTIRATTYVFCIWTAD
jgi:hypothetical protein